MILIFFLLFFRFRLLSYSHFNSYFNCLQKKLKKEHFFHSPTTGIAIPQRIFCVQPPKNARRRRRRCRRSYFKTIPKLMNDRSCSSAFHFNFISYFASSISAMRSLSFSLVNSFPLLLLLLLLLLFICSTFFYQKFCEILQMPNFCNAGQLNYLLFF